MSIKIILPRNVGRYAIGLDDDGQAYILSNCCEARVEYAGRLVTNCIRCGKREDGFSDTSILLIALTKHWVSAWTLIDREDLTITVDGEEIE